MFEDEICIIKNVGGVDEIFPNVSTIPSWFHSFLDVENVHQK
jgi:hypothetical protein